MNNATAANRYATGTASQPAANVACGTALQDATTLLGRVLLAALFIPAGWGKITGFEGTVGYIASVGLPLPALGAVIAIAVELGLGLMLLAGWRTRWAALGIAVFTLGAAFFFHAFWDAPADQLMEQQINFWKNVAIAGGLLTYVAFGPGRLSLDARTGRA